MSPETRLLTGSPLGVESQIRELKKNHNIVIYSIVGNHEQVVVMVDVFTLPEERKIPSREERAQMGKDHGRGEGRVIPDEK